MSNERKISFIKEILDIIKQKSINYLSLLYKDNEIIIKINIRDKPINKSNEQNTLNSEDRIVNKAKDLLKDKPQCSLRDIYRALGLKKSLVKSILSKYDEFKIIDTDRQTIVKFNDI